MSYVYPVVAAVLGAAAAVAIMMLQERFRLGSARKQAREILAEGRREVEHLKKRHLLDAREEAIREREKLMATVEARRAAVREEELRLEKRDRIQRGRKEDQAKQAKALEGAQSRVQEGFKQNDRRKKVLDKLIAEQTGMLQKITGMDRREAKELLLNRLDAEYDDDVTTRVMQHEQKIKDECEQRCREILVTGMQRYAARQTAETTVSAVNLASDDMKGRVIGREGRNIRAFEKATGVDVIVDDTPGLVVVSCFDTVRREIAKLSMEKLLVDGRIHPSRIEEVVAETQTEMEEHILEVGSQAARDADVPKLHEHLRTLLGRLKFRTSFSQNVLHHSVEVANLCGLMAGELGLDTALARRCGLLHDIGKAVDHEMEGGHPQIGEQIARKHGERDEDVLHAIAGHHHDLRIDRIYTCLVACADSISASRPGARRETLERYVKRLEDLEAVACEFDGVETAYAIQAGREVRVMADSRKTTDQSAAKMCRDIAKAIEKKLSYPGEVRVTMLRETRTTEFAR